MKKIEYTYTYGYDVTKETYPQRIERAKKEKAIEDKEKSPRKEKKKKKKPK